MIFTPRHAARAQSLPAVRGHAGRQRSDGPCAAKGDGMSVGARSMIVLGFVLLVIGYVAHIAILWTVGIILLVIGGSWDRWATHSVDGATAGSGPRP
ncbi:MAG: hypothetical protein QOG05_5663 [Streptosporangiaceae bacterium]|nr:hypothetical protein [Streptosporangiaceae bacterium]